MSLWQHFPEPPRRGTVVAVEQTKGNSELCFFFPSTVLGRGSAGNRCSYVEEGESIVERIRTISARWVGDICWVMCTIESMATSGLAWTRLERGES